MSKADLSNVTAEQRAQIIREERDAIALAVFNHDAGLRLPGPVPTNFDRTIEFLNRRIRDLVGGEPRIGDSNAGAS